MWQREVNRHGAEPTYRKPLWAGAWKPLGRGHGHMSVLREPRWQPCPAWSAPAALYVSAALPSKSLKHRALPPPGTGKARHLWTHTTVQFNHCCLFMARSQKDSRAGFRDDLVTGILSSLCHKGFHTQPAWQLQTIHYYSKVWSQKFLKCKNTLEHWKILIQFKKIHFFLNVFWNVI